MNANLYFRPVILCVDDEEIALDIRRRVLEKAGYKVLTTASAQKALELFRGNHVDLVLMEHDVPMLIYDRPLAAAMKRLKPLVPIAIYSAHWEPPEDVRFADTFITKLVSVDELLSTIATLLSNGPTAAAV